MRATSLEKGREKSALRLRIRAVVLAVTVFLVFTNPFVIVKGEANSPPVASFVHDASLLRPPQPGEPITFDASASYDPDGYILYYTWDFGDGNVTTVTTPEITHTYADDGNYTIALTVLDNSGEGARTWQIVEIRCIAWFRVVDPDGIPISNVTVTVFHFNGTEWVKAPAFWGWGGVEILYDYMTQPKLANTPSEKFRNPGKTASILRKNASNIGWEIRGWCRRVFFKFEYESKVVYWPNETSRVFSYRCGVVETHYYKPCHQAVWDDDAETYVIKTWHIHKDGVRPTQWHPIIVGFPLVGAPLSATITPPSVTMDLGQSQLFTSSVSGGVSPYTYQWYLNDSPVSGATSSSWTFSPAATGTYTVFLEVTDSRGRTNQSNTAHVTVNPTLSVFVSPPSVIMDVGQSQPFSSTVSGGTPPYSYQWYLNGAPISGATSSAWTFSPTSSGSYTVHLNVTDDVGVTEQSNLVSVAVNPSLSVLIAPLSVVMDLSQSQLFTSTVSDGTPPYTYQWYLNGTPVSSAKASNWTFTPSSSGFYTVHLRVTDNVGISVESDSASVIVNPELSVSISPASVVMDLGDNKTFISIVSGGTSPYSYQWYLNNTAVPGVTSSSWIFSPNSTGSYTVHLKVTDDVGFLKQSNIALVTVNPALSVFASPSSVVMDVGQSVPFSAIVSGGTPPYHSYQWYLNATPVTGATDETWVFTPSDPGFYLVYVEVEDSVSDPASSPPVSVTVNPQLTVSIGPPSVVMDVGQSQLFTSSVSGGTWPYSYQWYLNNTAVPGVTSSTWVFTPNITGVYIVHLNVTDAVGVTSKSNMVPVTVNPLPSVSIAPTSVAMDIYQSKTFTATAVNGTPPYRYDWYLNDGLVQSDTSSTWTFTPTAVGSYTICVNATDSVGVKAKSNVVPVTVNPELTVAISPSSVVMDVGQSVTFISMVSGGTLPYAYDWYLNETQIATSVSWTFTPTSPGFYHVYLNVTDMGDPTVKSNVANLTVNPELTVAISPSSVVMDVGQSQLFTSEVAGGTLPYSYQWYENDTTIGGATSPSLLFSPVLPGVYLIHLNVTDDVGVTVKSNVASVTVNPELGALIAPPAAVIDVGQSLLYTSNVTGGTPEYSYQWFLNESAVSGATSNSWTFTPTSPGVYSVYLNVTDYVGAWKKSNLAYVTVNTEISVSISPSSVTIQTGESQVFSSMVSGGTPPYTYQWYLNDSVISGAVSSEWTFTPTSAGYYIVYVKVTDNVGGQATSNPASVSVLGKPHADFTWSPPSPLVEEEVVFDASISTPDGGTIIGYTWDFGDSQTGTGKITSQAYDSAGTYTVTLNVTDSEDKWDIESKQITISTTPPPPPSCVGGEMVLVKPDKSVVPAPLDLVCLIVVAVAAAVVLTGRWKRRRQ